jgi:hypothetical protein
MAGLQVDDLGADLDIVVGERLGAFGAPYALHRAGLGLAADSDGTDAPLVLEEFRDDCAGGGAHAIMQLLRISLSRTAKREYGLP